MTLKQLYSLKNAMELENLVDSYHYSKVCEKIKTLELMNEDGGGTSATGGISPGGMGAVVNAQPSGLAGATIGTSWASHGGTTGSGDVSIPYNPSGANRVFQQMPMGKDHGPRTGKKSRTKKLDLKALKNIFAKRQDYTSGQGVVKKEPKVMSFDDFQKSDVNYIKR